MKTTNLLITCFYIAGLSAYAVAQPAKGKSLIRAARTATTVNVPAKIPGVKRFVYPDKKIFLANGQTSTKLTQLGVNLQRKLANAPVAAPEVPSLVMGRGNEERRFLEIAAQEQQFYQQEILNARNLHQLIKYNLLEASYTSEEEAQTAYENMLTQVSQLPNDYLRRVVSGELQAGHWNVAAEELANYYSIDVPSAQAAFHYSARHAHKRNLQTMRLLHNPFIDESFKTPIKEFLALEVPTPDQLLAFKNAVEKLYEQSQRITQLTLHSPEVRAQIAYLELMIGDLSKFIAKNGRLPKWNTRSKTEQNLSQRISELLHMEADFPFEPFTSYFRTIRQLVETHAPVYPSREDTLAKFDAFVKETGRIYPRACANVPNVPQEETDLYDALLYWRLQSEDYMGTRIRHIQNTHAVPNDPVYHEYWTPNN